MLGHLRLSADAFPEAGLAPALGAPARAPYYRWLFFAAGPVEAAVVNKSCGFEAPDKARMLGYGSFEQTMDTLEGVLSSGDYLAGGAFSAADLYLGSQLGWGMQFKTIPARPAFEAYVAKLHARPAFQKAKAIDAELIAEMQKA